MDPENPDANSGKRGKAALRERQNFSQRQQICSAGLPARGPQRAIFARWGGGTAGARASQPALQTQVQLRSPKDSSHRGLSTLPLAAVKWGTLGNHAECT